MAKKIDPVKAKAARQKKIAIIGGVLLLGLLAFQVPRTMKMLKGQSTPDTSASTPAASTTASGASALAPPTLDGGSTAGSASSGPSGPATATSSDGVADPSVPLPPSSGQLISFDRFKSKDPFRQQMQACGSAACGAAPAATPGGAGGASGSGTSGAGGGGTSGGGTNTATGGTGTSAGGTAQKTASSGFVSAPAKRTAATISVNGTSEKVSVGGDFPAATPVFTLVAVTANEAMVAIAGGSLQSGADAVGLKVGKTLKLQNTADQSIYVLKLISTS